MWEKIVSSAEFSHWRKGKRGKNKTGKIFPYIQYLIYIYSGIDKWYSKHILLTMWPWTSWQMIYIKWHWTSYHTGVLKHFSSDTMTLLWWSKSYLPWDYSCRRFLRPWCTRQSVKRVCPAFLFRWWCHTWSVAQHALPVSVVGPSESQSHKIMA